MPPSVERFGARLALLPHAELLELAAQGCHDIPAFRRDVDAELAIRTPVPDWVRSDVLLSPDLMPQIFASLDVEHHTAALVCKAWAAEWKTLIPKRRILRPAPAPGFKLKSMLALAALPGEEMAIASDKPERVYIVGQKRQLILGNAASGVTFDNVRGVAAGDDGLYVSEEFPARVRRFDLDTFAVAAERTSGEHHGFLDLTPAPGGVLFVLAGKSDHDEDEYTFDLLALDALSLAVRFKVGKDVLGVGWMQGLAVCGDEVYVGSQRDPSIRVLSLDGKPRRVISSQPDGWRIPGSLCCVADRLYLTEEAEGRADDGDDDEESSEEVTEEVTEEARLAGRRIFVLTPEGHTLQVYKSPRPLEERVEWAGMCHFDGKLIVADDAEAQLELIALQGL